MAVSLTQGMYRGLVLAPFQKLSQSLHLCSIITNCSNQRIEDARRIIIVCSPVMRYDGRQTGPSFCLRSSQVSIWLPTRIWVQISRGHLQLIRRALSLEFQVEHALPVSMPVRLHRQDFRPILDLCLTLTFLTSHILSLPLPPRAWITRTFGQLLAKMRLYSVPKRHWRCTAPTLRKRMILQYNMSLQYSWSTLLRKWLLAARKMG